MHGLKTETIHRITLPTPYLVGDVHVYLVKGEKHILIDTGPNIESSVKILEAELTKAGSSIQRIDLLILTHHHPDHIGAAHLFQGTAQIAGHSKIKPWLEKDRSHFKHIRSFFEDFYQENGMDDNFRLQIRKQHEAYLSHSAQGELHLKVEEGKLAEMPGWSVIETPGHAQTHISLLSEKDNLLIGGDLLISHISSNAILEAPYKEQIERPKTLLQFRESLKKCSQVKKVYSGHGEVIEHPQQLIRQRLDQQMTKAEMILKKLGQDQKTVFDLSKLVYPEIHKQQPDLTFSEILGHLDLLEQENKIQKEKINDSILYQQV